MAGTEPRHPALRSVYWREEILEVVLWLRGEGFDERVDAEVVSSFLAIGRPAAREHLERLRGQGYLHRMVDGRYGLTLDGEAEAQRIIRGPRSVPMAASGTCGPDCWCDTSPVEASRCAIERIG